MAGGVSKALGGVCVILGALLLIIGLVALVSGGQDERDNQGQLLPDGERSDQNEAILVGGAVALGGGLLLAIVGVVLLVIGAGRARRDELDVMRQVAAMSSAPSPTEDLAAASVSDQGRRRSTASIGTVVVVALVVFVGLVAWLGSGGSNFLGANDEESTLQTESKMGALRYSVGGQVMDPAGENVVVFALPEGARAGRLSAAWNHTDGGAQVIRFQVDHRSQGGAWETVEVMTGPSGTSTTVALDEGELRVVATPADPAQFILQQPFELHLLVKG